MRTPARWGIPDAVLTLVLAAVVTLAVVALIPVLGLSVRDPRVVLGGVVVPWLALLGWPLLTAWRKGHGPVADYGLRMDGPAVRAGLAGGLVALTLALVSAVSLIVLSDTPLSSAAGDLGRDLADRPAALIALAVLAVVGAPIVEEIAFRGLLLGALLKRGVPGWLAVGISAAVFAGFHFEPQRLPLLLVTGIVLGEVRRRTGSTAAAIVAHAVNNSFAALGLLSML